MNELNEWLNAAYYEFASIGKNGKPSRKRPLVPFPVGWTPKGIEAGNVHEFEKFRGWHVAKGSMFANWEQAWVNWLRKSADFAPKEGHQIRPHPSKVVDFGHWSHEDSPEWQAWDKFKRDTTGKGALKDGQFGWRFPTRWPPGHSSNSQAAHGDHGRDRAVDDIIDTSWGGPPSEGGQRG